MYNGQKDLLWKYTILNNPQKNCWVMTGPKSFKYGKAFGKEKYYLMYDASYKQAAAMDREFLKFYHEADFQALVGSN